MANIFASSSQLSRFAEIEFILVAFIIKLYPQNTQSRTLKIVFR